MKKYQPLEVKFIVLKVEDIITASVLKFEESGIGDVDDWSAGKEIKLQ